MQVTANSCLQKLDCRFADFYPQLTRGAVCDPLGNTVAGERVELKWCAGSGEGSVGFGPGGSGHDEQQIGRWIRQILIENPTGVLPEPIDLTKHYYAPRRHHRRSRDEDSQCLRIELGGPPRIEVEVPGSRIEGSIDQPPNRIVLLIL